MDRLVRRRFEEIEQKLNSIIGNITTSSSASSELEELKTSLLSSIALLETSHSKLMDRITVLEARPEQVPVDLTSLEKRILSLENKSVSKTAELQKRLDALEKLCA